MEVNLKNKVWYDYLEDDLRELLEQSFTLIDLVPSWQESFHDYSFIVFPSAKAYEGFLKKMFLDMGFITQEDYYGRHFRIGKALNPQLEKQYREAESVYDKLVEFCGGENLANMLWDTWKNCRNLIFHWFPDEKRAITFEAAKSRVDEIIASIDESFRECKIKVNDEERKSS